MIGFNGGLIGLDRTPTLGTAITGVWSLQEQLSAVRREVWIDPHYQSVSILLHGDGANNSTTFTDSSISPKSVSRVGGTVISTAQSKFGGSSILFDGDGDYLTVPDNAAFQLSTGDFTIESWVYVIAFSNAFSALVTNGNSTFTTQNGFVPAFFLLRGTAGAKTIYFGTSTTNPIVASTTAISTGVWHHVAVTRSGSTVRAFFNGTLEGTATNSENYNFGNNSTHIGRSGWSVDEELHGYLDEFRITKGVARYTASFTPAPGPFRQP
jgi:hypothetical protein